MQRAQLQDLGYQILDKFGHFFPQVIKQRLGFLAPEQFCRMRKNQVIEMRRRYRTGIDYGIAKRLCLFALGIIDPHRGQSECGILGHCPRQVA